jgi:tetratricopeptide (TPR) repeat protein
MAKRILFVVFVIFIQPGVVWAQESLQAAQTLYASAAYDEALAMLERLQKQPLAPSDLRELQQNRALCLLALGRTDDAEMALAAVVNADPMFKPNETMTSPRVRTIFKDVRSRLLPGLIVAGYNDARVLYDKQQWADALKGFQQVVALVADSDLSAADAKSVQEYKVLAEGFAKLAASAPGAAASASAAKAASSAGADGASAAKAGPSAGADGASAAAPAAPFAADHIYGTHDRDVTPPVTVRQDMPRWALQGHPLPRPGSLELVISAEGVVERATLTQAMSPAFDHLLLEATRNWKYQPAQADGRPVRYRKMIRITFQ